MSPYNPPKKKLHKEFAFLNHDSVFNALSAFEAGKVDQILAKTTEASQGGMEGALGVRGVKVGGGKKKEATMQEELVKTRTRFSAFDAWHQRLHNDGAIGTFNEWDMSVRDAVGIGDTISFRSRIYVSPIYKLISAFSSFLTSPVDLGLTAKQKEEMKKQGKQMNSWTTDHEGLKAVAIYLHPKNSEGPRIIARLSEKYLVSSISNIEGEYEVIAQIHEKLGSGEQQSIVRVLKDSPPTPLEVETVSNALIQMQNAAGGLGVEFLDADRVIQHPDVMVHPIAIYK